MLKPNAEVRYTNALDFWTVSRTNRLGFLDRPPPEGATAGCHVSFIGDSFIAAREVPIAQKVQVVLEQAAAQALPHLNITTSAFGRVGTAQANQIAIYEKWVRSLRPKILVSFFCDNDFRGNHALSQAVSQVWDPARPPLAYLERLDDGQVRLQPPSPHYQLAPELGFKVRSRAHGHVLEPQPMLCLAGAMVRRSSYFGRWVLQKLKRPVSSHCRAQAAAYWREQLSQRPAYQAILANQRLLRQEQVESTRLALRSLAERAQRDGTSLLLLSYVDHQSPQAIADELGIAVVSVRDYALRQGLEATEIEWDHDGHWNALGHRQAAAAVLEWLKENQGACGGSA